MSGPYTSGTNLIDEKTESIELGYCLGSQFFNKGYMTEAVTAIIRFFINEVGAGRVWARHDTENPNSGKVMAANIQECQ